MQSIFTEKTYKSDTRSFLDMADPRKRIQSLTSDLVERIYAYSASQKEHWQQIPFLALEADGRTGFSDVFARVYHTGYWALGRPIVHGSYQIYVDCADGSLVDAASVSDFVYDDVVITNTNKHARKPSQTATLSLATHLEDLDAKAIVKDLQKQTTRPYAKCYDPKKHDAWRDDLRARLGIETIFTRR